MGDIATLAAMTFVSPWLLAGSALAGLPIAAHLLSRHTRRRVVFPTIRLLADSAAGTSSLYRLRRWLVLILRCLAVFLIAWAFSRPVWHESRLDAASGDDGAAVVLLMDISASMDETAGGVSLSGSARALAERVLQDLNQGEDKAAIVLASARCVSPLPELTHNLDLVREELDRLRRTAERANFPEAIAQAGKLLSGHRGQRRLVIVSDMQRTNWADVTLKGKVGQALGQGVALVILPVGPDDSANISLSAPRAMPLAPIVGQPVKLAVHVNNYSSEERTVSLNATLDGKTIGTREVSLKAWGGAEADFETTLPALGAHRVVFSVASDALSIDNNAHLSVRAVRRVGVVVVGDDNPTQPGTSTYFLVRALSPRGDQGDRLEVRHLAGGAVTYARIADAEAVFVGYVDALDVDALRVLYMYLNQGGGIAFYCGGGPVSDNLMGLKGVSKQVDVLPWYPGPQRNLAADGEFLRIAEGDWTAPVLADFDVTSRAALKKVRFGRVWSAGVLRNGAVRMLEYNDGTPALSAMPVGVGKIAICNFSPSMQCSDLGKYGGFVALTHGLFHYLRPTQQQHGRAIAGRTFTYPASTSGAADEAELTVLGPDERPCEVSVSAEGDKALVHFSRAALPGFYSIRQGGGEIACVAVNTDPRESDLRRADPVVLREHLAGDNMVLKIHDHAQPGPILRMQGTELWYWFVLAAMGAIAAELVLLCLWKQ